MNIDIEKWPSIFRANVLIEGFYWRKSSGSDPALVYLKPSDELRLGLYEYRGPVSFGPCDPHLDLSSLDLSKYPVVDKPDRPGLWRWRNDSGLFGYSCLEEKDFSPNVVYSHSNTWQRIGDFTPPAPALPEVPEVELVLIKHPDHEKPMWFAEVDNRLCCPQDCEVLRRVPFAPKEVV